MDFTLEADGGVFFHGTCRTFRKCLAAAAVTTLRGSWPLCSTGALVVPRLFSNVPRPSTQVHAVMFNANGCHFCSHCRNGSIGGKWCRPWVGAVCDDVSKMKKKLLSEVKGLDHITFPVFLFAECWSTSFFKKVIDYMIKAFITLTQYSTLQQCSVFFRIKMCFQDLK